MGDVVTAVDRYQDIPLAVRERLKQRMRERRYDEIVSIRRDGVTGRADYSSEITDMHFGEGSVCKTVSRKQWATQAEERGLVYCEGQQCILVPTVCRNVSRIKRKQSAVAPARAGDDAASSRELELDPQAQLEMDPPGAGPLAGLDPNAEHASFAQIAGLSPANVGSLMGLGAGPGAAAAGGGSGDGHYGGGGAGPTVGGLGTPPYLPPGALDTPPNEIPPQPAPPLPGVPEPSSWLMFATGMLALRMLARRRCA